MSYWKPIKTAPRDGTPVDLWHKEGFRCTDVWWDSEDECWTNLMSDSHYSHWSPVPPPPGFKPCQQ